MSASSTTNFDSDVLGSVFDSYSVSASTAAVMTPSQMCIRDINIISYIFVFFSMTGSILFSLSIGYRM